MFFQSAGKVHDKSGNRLHFYGKAVKPFDQLNAAELEESLNGVMIAEYEDGRKMVVEMS